ncbi:hypothetical protein NLJ89_g4298 [Agrocybe chaxingu]|uniref:CENP-V/GFA domain-containing protein n=1 Tax=Agrocybe chaxingu TaxID=84603 RepID=A0A9W8K9W9_9AGAR|nr:hypothetical protein NLJ89_g4298 [Agrocybe chaxingu]
MSELTYVNGSCHCGLNTFRVGFVTSSLPLSTNLCHCSICRHTSGQLAFEHAPISGSPISRSSAPATEDNPSIPLGLAGMTGYQSSSNVTRYFCKACSAHLFRAVSNTEADGDKKWAVAAGALETTDGILKVSRHTWVSDTLDGGIADHLRQIKGVGELPRYKEGVGSPEVPLGWNIVDVKQGGVPLLKAFCHCRALRFAISRPTDKSVLSAKEASTYPDLMYAYISTEPSKIQNPNGDPWWLTPHNSGTKTKYLAGHCTCTTCRLTSGSEVQSWTFVPLLNILVPSPTAPPEADEWVPLCLLKDEERPKGLTQYNSSPGKFRESCSTCGATGFWWRKGVPNLIDFSVGLLDESIAGTRAVDWLDWWTGRVSFEEEALSHEIASGLEEGLKEYASKA